MNGYRRENTELRDLQSNQGITETAVDESLYRLNFSASILKGPVDGFVGPAYCAVYGKAAGTVNGRADIVPPENTWIAGNLSVVLVWSGTVASTITNVQWAISLSISALGAAPFNVGTYSFAPAGPAIVNGVQSTAFPNPVGPLPIPWPVDASTVLVGVNITRQAGLGTDTYLGDANVFGFKVIYTPAGGH